MRDEHHEQAGQEASSRAQPGKKPYQKPAFRYERVFETMALACGKIDDTQLPCFSLPSAS
jgi:hypothetical protein